MDWDDLRHFLALARHGRVRAAGAQLRVSHTTVARRVEALEAELGTRLFDRHRDGYVLTEAGARLVPAAERVEDGVSALAREVMGMDRALRGPVHVTCGDEFVAGWILEDLAPWCAGHPGVELSVSIDGRSFNLAKGEADLAIRALPVGQPAPEQLVARSVAPIVVASYVARAHAARLDPAGTEARWLGTQDPRMIEVLRGASSYPSLPVWGAFGAAGVLVAAAVQGLGLAILPTYMGDHTPALQRLAQPDLRHLGTLWLLSHPDLHRTARVQAVRRILMDGFARRQGLFVGRSTAAPERSENAPRVDAMDR